MDEIATHVRTLQIGDALSKTAAAEALAELAYCDEENEALIAEAGGIEPLIHLLRDGSAEAKTMAARALDNLAYFNDANQILIAEAGGVPPLVDLLRNGIRYGKANWKQPASRAPSQHFTHCLVVYRLLTE